MIFDKLRGIVFDDPRLPDPDERSEYERAQDQAVTKMVELGYCWESPGPWEIGQTLVPHRLNSDRTVAVATDYCWNEDMDACPRGVKVQLLGVGGVASYGTYNGRDPFWVAWAPVPKRRPTKT